MTLFRLFILVIIAAVALCLVAPERSLHYVGKLLIKSDQPQYADAIITLLGADTPERVIKSYELLNQGIAKRIVFGSGHFPKRVRDQMPSGLIWEASGHRYQVALTSLGIPENSLLQVNTENAFDTSGELTAVCTEAKALGWREVVLVSSPFHTRRAWLIWQRVCPEIFSSAVPAYEENLNTWWREPRLIRAVGYEYGALVKELIRQVKD